MKKIIVIVLALTMIFSFGACGNEKEEPQPDTQTVKVTFDCVGGSLISSMEIKKGSTIVQPADPSKDGYVFDCWYYNGSAFDFAKAINEDITLYATWKEADKKDSLDDNKPDGNTDTLDNNKPDDNKENQENDNNESISVEKLSWENSWYWAYKGVVGDPVLTVIPESAKSSVKFSSSNEEIAVVDENGLITGLKGGKVVITATCGDKKAELPFTVKDDATGIKLNKDVITLKYMSQYDYCDDLVATVEPEWAYNTNVNMYIDNSEVAYFDADGVIHALKPGKATITAEDAYGHKATCQLYVNGATLSYTFNTNQYYRGSVEEYYIWLDSWRNGEETFTNVASLCSMKGSATQYLKADGYIITSKGIVPEEDVQTTVYFTLDSGPYAGLQTDDVTFTILNY